MGKNSWEKNRCNEDCLHCKYPDCKKPASEFRGNGVSDYVRMTDGIKGEYDLTLMLNQSRGRKNRCVKN